ncbi:MAG TPA: hypothetical protein VLE93_00255 [Candidatus Saccharimonadales bacterium]|nr:hypothetical protein [Candidatus Saccharimonadales bacterium]
MWQLLVPTVFAQNTATGCTDKQFYVGLALHGTHCFGSFSAYLVALFGEAINIAFALAILMVLWGAFKYLSAGGDDGKVKDAKDTIVGAVIGFALLVLVKVLLPLFQIQ